MATARIVLEVDTSTGNAKLAATSGELKKTGTAATEARKQIAGMADDMVGRLGPASSVVKALGPAALAAGAAFAAAALAIGTVVAAVGKLAQKADELATLQDRTALSAKALQDLQLAAKLGNTSVDALAASVNRMQRAMVDTPDKFKRIGVSVDELRQMAPEEQFQKVAKALMSIEDPAARVAAGQELLGKGFAQQQAALEAVATGASELAGTLDAETIEQMANLQDQLDRLDTAWERMKLNLTAAVAGGEETAGIFGDVADAIAELTEALKENGGILDSVLQRYAHLDPRNALRFIGGVARVTTALLPQRLPGVGGPGGPDMGPGMGGEEALALLGKGLTEELGKAKKESNEIQRAHERAARESARIAEHWRKWELSVLHGSGAMGQLYGNFGKILTETPANQASVIGVPMRNFGDLLTQQMGASGSGRSSWGTVLTNELKRSFKAGVENLPHVILGAIQGGGNVLQAAGVSLGGAVGMGMSDTITKLFGGGGLGKMLGSLAGPLGSLLGGGVSSLIGKLFGGSEEKRVNPLRQQFIDAAGGLDALNKKAHDAGLTLDRLLNAKTVKDYEAAVRELSGAFDLQTQAEQERTAAAEKYGLVSQDAIDKAGMQLLKERELLMTQFEQAEVMKAMAPQVNAWVQEALAAGRTIPGNWQPILEQMAQLGLLTNAAGESVDTLEEAGISGFGAISDSVKSLIDEIRRLVAALTGVPTSLPNASTGALPNGGSLPRHGEGYQGGTGGIRNFGAGSLHPLHGLEGVFRPMDFAEIAQMMGGHVAAALAPLLAGLGRGIDGAELRFEEAGVARLLVRQIENNTEGVRSTIRREASGPS